MKNLRIFVQMTGANLRGLMSFKVDFLVSFFAGLLSQTDYSAAAKPPVRKNGNHLSG